MLEKCERPNLNVFHPKWIIGTHGNWKKSKSWGPFRSYRKTGPNGLNCQCCLAASSKTAPRFFFQLPWVTNLHISWNLLLAKRPPNIGIIIYSWVVWKENRWAKMRSAIRFLTSVIVDIISTETVLLESSSSSKTSLLILFKVWIELVVLLLPTPK